MNTTAKKCDTIWFKSRLAGKDLTQAALARHLKMDTSAVSRMIQGTRKFKLEEAGAVAKVLSVSVEEVLARAGADVAIPSEDELSSTGTMVMGWIDGAGEIRGEGVEGPKKVERISGFGPSVWALRHQCEGALDGSLIYFVPTQEIDPQAIGKLSVVKREDGGSMLRVIKRGYDRGTFNCFKLCNIDTISEKVRLVSAAPVLWMKM